MKRCFAKTSKKYVLKNSPLKRLWYISVIAFCLYIHTRFHSNGTSGVTQALASTIGAVNPT